ncbi:MAG: hypothetical protein ACRC1M_06620 [Methanobacteriaceae archaeon]
MFFLLLVFLASVSCVSAVDVDFDTSLNKTISNVASNSNATIRLNEATYKGNGNHSVYISNSKNVTIIGKGVNKTIINGSNSDWIFNVDSSSSLTLINLTIANADNSERLGGAIYNRGTLSVVGCSFVDNSARHGGAIYSSGTLSVVGCSFVGNFANSGAAIRSGTWSVSDSSFVNNGLNVSNQVYGSYSLSNSYILLDDGLGNITINGQSGSTILDALNYINTTYGGNGVINLETGTYTGVGNVNNTIVGTWNILLWVKVLIRLLLMELILIGFLM